MTLQDVDPLGEWAGCDRPTLIHVIHMMGGAVERFRQFWEANQDRIREMPSLEDAAAKLVLDIRLVDLIRQSASRHRSEEN